MAEIKDYSVTADDNNSASPNGMPENQAPSTVNNSVRETLARVKRWYEDINGTKSTTGSSNAYVLAAARTVTAYAQGDAYMFRANHANTGAATLNIDSVGAVAIVNNTQSALAAGQIQAGGIYLVAYDATNSKFQLVGASATSASGDNIFVFNASPSVTLTNSTAEDSDGGRESTIQWKGLQSGSEESTLVKIIGSHDGSSDDQKGKLQIYTNDGSDGDSPTLQVTIDSAGLCTLVGAASVGGSLTVAGATQLNSTVTVGANDQGYDVILYGDTASANVTWDTSVDDLILNGAAGLIVPDGQLTLGSTAVTSTGAELNYNDTGAAVGTVVASKTVTVDANKDVSSFRNITLTGELDAGSLDVSGNADIDGTLEADAMTLDGTAITTTATLSTGISDGNVPVFTSGVADDDFLRVAGTSIEGRSAAEVLSDIGASAVAGSSSIVTVGALNSGSITSGFGSIDNGSSAITTTGVITGGTVEATTDTAAGDNAAIGYTSAEGLILTGQGSNSDITFKNDGDTTVFSIPTGAADVLFPDGARALFGAGSDLQIFHDGSNSYITDAGTGALIFKSNTYSFRNAADNEQVMLASEDGAVTLYYDNAAKLATSASGVTATGTLNATTSLDSPLAAIRNPGAGQLYLRNSSSINRIDSYNDPISATYPLQLNASQITFFIADAQKMILDSSGKVGIGVAAPAAGLHIESTGTEALRTLRLAYDGTYYANIAQAGASGLYYRTYGGLHHIWEQAGTERMRISATSGKVGIGTSAPDAQLQVHSAALGTTAGDTVNILELHSPDTSNNTVYRFLNYRHSNGSSHDESELRWQRRVDVSNHGYIGLRNEAITFGYGNNTELMRLRNNGQFLINSTSIIASDNAYLQVTGGSVTPVALRGGTNNYFMAFYKQSNNDLIGSITGSTGSTTSFNTSSDYRLKENVDYSWDATTRLKQLKPARFNFISDPDNTVDGFIAHEVQEVVPHAVTGVKDGEEMQGIDHSKLVPLLTASLQEALKRIDSLEEQVNALKGK